MTSRFVKYNDNLRGFGPALRGCEGNRYVTTTHVINSCIVKASKLTKVAKVYRGVAGGLLPKSFWEPDNLGVQGGVEQAFMSTTFERDVAMRYASQPGKPNLVLEIETGMVDRGCEFGWISQYPHERESVFPPLTGVQVTGTHVDGAVLVVHARLSVNLKSPTIEQVISKMKTAQLELLNSVQQEGTSMQLQALQKELQRRDAKWFNDPHNFKKATKDILNAKNAGGTQGATTVALVESNAVSGPGSASVAAAPMQSAWTTAAWLASVKVDALKLIADALVGTSPTDQLTRARALGSDSVAQLILRLHGAMRELVRKLCRDIRTLAEVEAASGAELHSKFVQNPDAFVLQFNHIAKFFGGLEKEIGSPEVDVLRAMEREHTAEDDSRDDFDADGSRTKPTLEWMFVVRPDEAMHRDWGLRCPLPISELERRRSEKNQELAAIHATLLLLEEVYGARLYTGPM